MIMIEEIKREIARSMNGICAVKIRESGLGYKTTFGVDWVRLREIAAGYAKNYDMAWKLWQSDVREHKLIATLLCPSDEMNTERLGEWMKGVFNTELAEIISFALLSRRKELIPDLIILAKSEKALERLTAFLALGRFRSFSNDLAADDLQRVRENVRMEDREDMRFVHAIENLF